MTRATLAAPVALLRRRCRAALASLLALLSGCSSVHVHMAPDDAVAFVGAAPHAGPKWEFATRAWTPPNSSHSTYAESPPRAAAFAIAEAEARYRHALTIDATDDASVETVLLCYLDLARFTYAYIAFAKPPSGSDLHELRGLYNYASERVVELLLARRRHPLAKGAAAERLALLGWQVRLDQADALGRRANRSELVPTSRLRFDGIGRVHVRDGFGATFVALGDAHSGPMTLEQVPFAAATIVLRFAAKDFEEALRSRQLGIELYDPTRAEHVALGRTTAPLAANFSAPFALWLAHARFERQAEFALFLRSSPLTEPRIFALQPYDPNREIIVLIHGFGSSPATWAELVNSIAGDAELRSRYQIWEVFYPTNVPPVESQRMIRASLARAFAAVDPDGAHIASRNVTLIGHSLGGVIARLLVLDSGDALWHEVFGTRFEQARTNPDLAPYLSLDALPQIDTAIFVAAPHRGVPAAGNWLGRLAARFIRLPASFVARVSSLRALLRNEQSREEVDVVRHPTSVRGLRAADNFLRVTASLPISSRVTYHTIVGRKNRVEPLMSSSDGLVPYSSAHLDGAASECVVTSSHSVHESAEGIAEIERILRERARPRPLTAETMASLDTPLQ